MLIKFSFLHNKKLKNIYIYTHVLMTHTNQKKNKQNTELFNFSLCKIHIMRYSVPGSDISIVLA